MYRMASRIPAHNPITRQSSHSKLRWGRSRLCWPGEMAVGYFIVHAPLGFFPSVNGGDAAILFCSIFLGANSATYPDSHPLERGETGPEK
jgi:hypothetical protein